MKPHAQLEHILPALQAVPAAASPQARTVSRQSWADLPAADASAETLARSSHHSQEAGDVEDVFTSPLAMATPPIPKIYKRVVSNFPLESQATMNEFINALSTIPEDEFSINPQSQEILIKGKPIRDSDIASVLGTMNSPTEARQVPLGTKQTARLLAESTNLPASIIKSPKIREYVIGIRQKAASQAQPSKQRRSRQTEYSEYSNPAKWKEVESLTSATRTGSAYK